MKKIAFFPFLSLLLLCLLSSCGGSGDGEESTSSPGSAPIAVSVAATMINENSATLNGTVNPNGLATRAWFEYGTDPGLQTYASSPDQDAGDGTSAQPVSANLGSLASGTTYHFRVCAENSGGYSEGQILSLTTASPGSAPSVTTIAATSVGATEATLNGSVIANGLATTAWFEWGTDSSLATFSSTPSQSVGSGTTSQSVNAGLSSLSTGTTYYYRIAASNSSGTTKGSILSFLPGAAPAVTTLAATLVGSTGATLNGEVNPNGLATDAWFEWGTSPGLDTFSKTLPHPLGDGTDVLPVTATLSGLNSVTTYYYRVAASNASGSAAGSIASLTTASISPFGVVSTTPEDNATDVPLGSLVTVTFNRDVDPATLVGAITVTSSTGDLPGTISYNYTTATATFTPGAPFAPLTDYTVTVDDKVKSEDGVRLTAPYVFGFRTGS